MNRPVDIPAALFTWSAANCVALDTAREVVLGPDNALFCCQWENDRDDIFQQALTALEEELSMISVRRQKRFIHTWAVALATRRQ